MTPLVVTAIACTAVVVVAACAGLTVFLVRQFRRQKIIEQRIQRIAAPLTGDVATPDGTANESIILRSRGKRWHLLVVLERRYPLINPVTTIPKALGLGLLGGATIVAALWFLRIPFGWWTLPLFGASAAVAAWWSVGRFQKRLQAEFIAKFPATVDQIVRLSATGVPVLEAASSITDHAPHPVKPVLAMFGDHLMAGIDADEAARAVSDRFRIPELSMFMAVVRLQRRAGGGISAAFSNLSNTLRERRQTSLKAKSSTAQTRFTLVVLAVLPLVLLGIQSQTSPEAIEILFDTETGIMLLRGGFLLVFLGILAARAIAARAVR